MWRTELESVFEGQDCVQDYIDRTEEGDLITVYKPIKDRSGNVVAILGCDYNAETVVASFATGYGSSGGFW